MDPLVAGALATFGGTVVATMGTVLVGRMNTKREKQRSAEETAALVTQQRLEFKDEQVDYWKSRYEMCMGDRQRER